MWCRTSTQHQNTIQHSTAFDTSAFRLGFSGGRLHEKHRTNWLCHKYAIERISRSQPIGVSNHFFVRWGMILEFTARNSLPHYPSSPTPPLPDHCCSCCGCAAACSAYPTSRRSWRTPCLASLRLSEKKAHEYATLCDNDSANQPNQLQSKHTLQLWRTSLPALDLNP